MSLIRTHVRPCFWCSVQLCLGLISAIPKDHAEKSFAYDDSPLDIHKNNLRSRCRTKL